MSDFQKVLSKLLQGTRLRQPFSYDPYKTTYRNDLGDRFSNFLDRIDKFKEKGEVEKYFFENKEQMRELCSHIMDAIDFYLKGNSGLAYDKIQKIFSLPIIKKNIRHIIHDMEPYHNNHNDHNEYNSLFRVRLSETHISERSEIFHIPFQFRNLVATQRFSIAGLPCLYLGTSLYVCWQEMGKPDLNKLYLSRFSVRDEFTSKDARVINFAYSLETLKKSDSEELLFWEEDDKENVNLHIAYIVFFPLLMASTYNRAYESASFHSEYIFPNLFLQWISTEKNIDGITYFSTKTKQLRHSKIGVNFVFPPSTEDLVSNGFCNELKSKFIMTKPISWQVLDTISGNEKVINNSFNKSDDLEKQFIKNYRNTKFHQAEEKLTNIMTLGAIGT